MKVYEPIYKHYQIYVGGYDAKGNSKEFGTFEPWEFIKILRNTKDGASGVGLTVEVSKALETAYQTLLYQLGMVSTGGNKRGFLKATRKLTQEEIDTLKRAWKNLYANNSENVVILNNGLEFQEASNSAVETQLNESKRTLADEINALFHIYPNDFFRTFKEAIYPVVRAFETALNRDLLLEKEKKNHFFEFDVKEIIRTSLKDRYESYKLAKETGFMTLNEIRRAENMPWIEGLDVVNVGLGAVLYDTNKHVYYTPNTDTVGDMSDETEKTEEMLEGHELAQEFDASGNSADA
jgi:HK97 family phage portal protein